MLEEPPLLSIEQEEVFVAKLISYTNALLLLLLMHSRKKERQNCYLNPNHIGTLNIRIQFLFQHLSLYYIRRLVLLLLLLRKTRTTRRREEEEGGGGGEDQAKNLCERERELCYTYRVWKRSFKAR